MGRLQEGQKKYIHYPDGANFREALPNGGIQFTEVPKYFKLPDGVEIPEPILASGSVGFSLNGITRGLGGQAEIEALKDQFTRDMERVAPDLASNNLAKIYSESLFNALAAGDPKTNVELTLAGMNTFYYVGRDVLGPLAVSFVDSALREAKGNVVFPARDATPFFYAAKALKMTKPGDYPAEIDRIHNTSFNRQLWGENDELVPGSRVRSVTDPEVQALLEGMGFYSAEDMDFVEVGCWGSMVHHMNTAISKGLLPNKPYNVRFFFTHMPEYIDGFTNRHSEGIPADEQTCEAALETIADTWEAFPKQFIRPTELVMDGGKIKVSLEGKIVDSPFLAAWQVAGLQGVVDAAVDFAISGKQISPQEEILRLWKLSNDAQDGTFTGVLPGHTQTWSEGREWKANWRWGQIAPLT